MLREVTLDSLHLPGNATHGFMDFMLMMGIAGHRKADHADHLDLFHTMEAYFTWYPSGTDDFLTGDLPHVAGLRTGLEATEVPA